MDIQLPTATVSFGSAEASTSAGLLGPDFANTAGAWAGRACIFAIVRAARQGNRHLPPEQGLYPWLRLRRQ
jgi:hypothetical protein